ncbi:MAG TPA: universal stress protein [Gammaproteobacteria bacterium]|nr:universal stress protein [Gammaproteobacteria bacterium]
MFSRILLPVDLQETAAALRAAEIAVDQARKHGAELHVLAVLPGVGMPLVSTYFPRDAIDRARHDLDRRLADWVRDHVPADVTVSRAVREGAPHREILDEIGRSGADLVVMASHDDPRVDRALLGSVASKVVERSHVSVMVIRAPGHRHP